MLVWVTLVVGSVLIIGGVLVMFRVDQRWRRAHLQCCRCLQVWYSRHKLCDRCNARGHSYDWLARKFAGFPTHDWQGYLDTGPIPVVPVARVPAPRSPVLATPTPAPRPAPVPRPVGPAPRG